MFPRFNHHSSWERALLSSYRFSSSSWCAISSPINSPYTGPTFDLTTSRSVTLIIPRHHIGAGLVSNHSGTPLCLTKNATLSLTSLWRPRRTSRARWLVYDSNIAVTNPMAQENGNWKAVCWEYKLWNISLRRYLIMTVLFYNLLLSGCYVEQFFFVQCIYYLLLSASLRHSTS